MKQACSSTTNRTALIPKPRPFHAGVHGPTDEPVCGSWRRLETTAPGSHDPGVMRIVRAKQVSNRRVGVWIPWIPSRARRPSGALGTGFRIAWRERDACRIRRRGHPSTKGPAVGQACGRATYPRAEPAERRDRGHCRAQRCWTRRTAPRHPGNPSRTARPSAEGRAHRQASP